MFDEIRNRLDSAFGKFRRPGVLTEANISEGLREIRAALLEADVHYQVVQEFIANVREKAVGAQLIKSVRPDDQIVKIVHDELLQLMGPVDPSIRFEKSGPTVLMLCGLQGSGKTTTCGKLAKLLVGQGRRPLMVAADLQRPAAIEQLRTLGRQLEIPVHSEDETSDPVGVCHRGLIEANRQDRDTVLLDTAGRLHIDDDLMRQLQQIEKKVRPHQVYFVCDAMTGQDAVVSAGAFNEALELDGVILTKIDGDARGGAALSVRKVTGVPIKFMGEGEKLDKLSAFDPRRIVDQMLGRGDIISLVEDAKRVFDEEEAKKQQERLQKGKFDLNDFRKQLIQMKKLGSVRDIANKIPGMSKMMPDLDGVDADGEVKRIQGMIDSMTPEERSNPKVINQARRRRVAAGSGAEPADVSGLIKQFDAMAGLTQQMANLSMMDRINSISKLAKSGALQPGAKLAKPKQSSGKRLSPKERARLQKERAKQERRKQREEREKKRRDKE